MSSSICQWDQIGTRELAAMAPLAATAGTPASHSNDFLQQAASILRARTVQTVHTLQIMPLAGVLQEHHTIVAITL